MKSSKADLGDFVGVEGDIMKTNVGELTIHAGKLNSLV